MFYCRCCDLAATAAHCFVFVHCCSFSLSPLFRPRKLLPLLSGLLLNLFFLLHLALSFFLILSISIRRSTSVHATRWYRSHAASAVLLLRPQGPDVSASDPAVGISASPRVGNKEQGLWRIGGSWVGLVEPRLGSVPGSRRCLNVISCFLTCSARVVLVD